jgi:hypothetical protein
MLLTLFTLILTSSETLDAATPTCSSGRTIPAADRSDLALDTGLWRSKFLKTQDEETSPTAGLSDDERHQSLQALRAGEVHKNSDIIDLEGAAEEFFEDGNALPAELTGDEILATTVMPEHLSDWEQALCNVSDGKTLAAGQKGPSMITAVIAVVGVIVVIGAYMKK